MHTEHSTQKYYQSTKHRRNEMLLRFNLALPLNRLFFFEPGSRISIKHRCDAFRSTAVLLFNFYYVLQ